MGKEFHTLLSLIFRVQHTPEEKEEREEKCNEDNFEVKWKVKQKHGFYTEFFSNKKGFVLFPFFLSSDLLLYRYI